MLYLQSNFLFTIEWHLQMAETGVNRPIITNHQTPKICKHCGTECFGKFCPECGQASDTSRLTARLFFQQIVNGLFKLNSTFLHTALILLVSPWKIIRDYIAGHRICYTQPVTMLAILLFFFAALSALSPISGWHQPTNDFALRPLFDDFGIRGILIFLFAFMSVNKVVFVFWIIPPAALAIRTVYHSSGANKFNWVEYACAGTYLACSYMCFAIVALILCSLWLHIEFGLPLTIYIVCISILTIWKSFSHDTFAARLWKMALAILCAVIYYTVYIIIFAGGIYAVFLL